MMAKIERFSGILAVFAAATAVAQSGDEFADVEISTHSVTEEIFYLEGRGGNIGVLAGSQGIVLIDTQFAPLTGRLIAAVAAISDAPIRFVINTHVHPDHTGGNENFQSMGYPVVAHDNVRVRMAHGINSGEPSPGAALPTMTFVDELGLNVNQRVRLIKAPASHTDGDVYVHFVDSNVLHLGDVFRTTGYPVIDFGNGGSAAGTLAALQLAIDLADPDTVIIPGHGVLSSVADVSEFRAMIAEVMTRVAALLDAGMTLEQVLAAAPTADLDARWGGSPERFLTGMYQSLAADNR